MSTAKDALEVATAFIEGMRLMLTTPEFLALLVLGWSIGWVVLRWWFGREIANARSDTVTATNSSNFYKEELAIAKSAQAKPSLNVAELAEAIKTNPIIRETLREVIKKPQVTRVDPSKPPEQWNYPDLLPPEEVKKVAALSFTLSRGTTTATVTMDGSFANTASPMGVMVWKKISGKDDDDKK